MTFTIQEVPDQWNMAYQDMAMYDSTYDKTLKDILADQDEFMKNVLLKQNEVKIEEAYSQASYTLPPQYQQVTSSQFPSTTSLESQWMNLPSLCEVNQTVIPPPQVVPSISSPLNNTYNVNSPADSTRFTPSPVKSFQQPMSPPDGSYMQFLIKPEQSSSPPPHVVPTSDYGYYGYEGKDLTGKYGFRDTQISPQEFQKRQLRRERNKEAAQRCRDRRRLRIEALEKETDKLEEQNEKVELDIKKLQAQVKELRDMLKSHACQMKTAPKEN